MARGVRTTVRWKVRHRLLPGDLGRVTSLHGVLYATEYGYDRTFEAYVADGLAEFVRSFRPEKDRIWVAEARGRVIGSIAIVGRPRRSAQLRWFLVHPDHRGQGLGTRLMQDALRFCEDRGVRAVFLWTTSELEAAGRLYTRFGFTRAGAKTHMVWGKRVTEERYERRLRATARRT